MKKYNPDAKKATVQQTHHTAPVPAPVMVAPTAPTQQAAPITQPQQQAPAANTAAAQTTGTALPTSVLLRPPQQSPLRIGGPPLGESSSDLGSDDADHLHLSNSPARAGFGGYHEIQGARQIREKEEELERTAFDLEEIVRACGAAPRRDEVEHHRYEQLQAQHLSTQIWLHTVQGGNPPAPWVPEHTAEAPNKPLSGGGFMHQAPGGRVSQHQSRPSYAEHDPRASSNRDPSTFFGESGRGAASKRLANFSRPPVAPAEGEVDDVGTEAYRIYMRLRAAWEAGGRKARTKIRKVVPLDGVEIDEEFEGSAESAGCLPTFMEWMEDPENLRLARLGGGGPELEGEASGVLESAYDSSMTSSSFARAQAAGREIWGTKTELALLGQELATCAICRVLLVASTVVWHVCEHHPTWYGPNVPTTSYSLSATTAGLRECAQSRSAAQFHSFVHQAEHFTDGLQESPRQTAKEAHQTCRLKTTTGTAAAERRNEARQQAAGGHLNLCWAEWSTQQQEQEFGRLDTARDLYPPMLFNGFEAVAPYSPPGGSEAERRLQGVFKNLRRMLTYWEGGDDTTLLGELVRNAYTLQVISFLAEARATGGGSF
jgi:hypothetical protein